jgi:hypothetical protein
MTVQEGSSCRTSSGSRLAAKPLVIVLIACVTVAVMSLPRVSMAQNGDVFNNNTRGGTPTDAAAASAAACRQMTPPSGYGDGVIMTGPQYSEFARRVAQSGQSPRCYGCGEDTICYERGGVEEKVKLPPPGAYGDPPSAYSDGPVYVRPDGSTSTRFAAPQQPRTARPVAPRPKTSTLHASAVSGNGNANKIDWNPWIQEFMNGMPAKIAEYDRERGIVDKFSSRVSVVVTRSFPMVVQKASGPNTEFNQFAYNTVFYTPPPRFPSNFTGDTVNITFTISTK